MTRALWLGACVVLLAGCKREEVPFTPPVFEDAPPAPRDAAEVQAIDAPPPAPPTATKIVVGDHTSCALMSDTSVRCWGKNSEGQLGIGTTADSPSPAAPRLRGVTDLVLGTAHACALLDDNSVTCWGRINFGRSGDLLVPTAVPGLARARRVFAVGTASCATLVDGSLVCWGDVDVRGRPRLSGSDPEQRVPTPVAGLERVVALTVNGALLDDGTVMAWGTDGTPQRTELSGVAEIAASGEEICGLRGDGSVGCVGPATHCAKAGGGSRNRPRRRTAARPAPAPSTVASVEVLRLPRAKHLAFDVGLCVVTAGGRLQCLDTRDGCRADDPWPGLTRVDRVSGSCALSQDGKVRCWSVEKGSRVVTRVAGVGGAVSLAASSSHACALLDTGDVTCWGSNRSGALGRGEANEAPHLEAKVVAF